MKWTFYVIVFVNISYIAVYGAKVSINSLEVEPVNYGKYETYLPPGSTKTISCLYKNNNQEVQWLDPSGQPISQSKKNRIFTQKHLVQTLQGDKVPALLLTFTETSLEDSGEYECQSEELSDTISMCVIDPLTFVDTPFEVSVDEGRSITLTCEARGRPEPRLVWYRNDKVISDDHNSTKYKVMTKFNSQGFQGLLTIASVDPEDDGSYTCEAIQDHKSLEDCNYRQEWNITLHVNYAPVFDDGDVTILFAKYNKSVDFICEPKAYPAPSYRWFSQLNEETKRPEYLNYPPEKVKSIDNNTKTVVTIVANALTFNMMYICRVTNSLGDASKKFTVRQWKKPYKPMEVDVFNSTDTQIELNVTWSKMEYIPVEEIHVQCLEKFGKARRPKESEWRKVQQKRFDILEKVDFESPVINVTIADLDPETDYWIRLRASNELGYSDWSTPILVSTDEVSTDAPELDEDESEPEEVKKKDEARTDTMFYGVFFAGGLLVVSFLSDELEKKISRKVTKTGTLM